MMTDREVLEMSELCHAVVEGELDQRGQQTLESYLAESEPHRQFYIRYMDLSANLYAYSQEMQQDGRVVVRKKAIWQNPWYRVAAGFVLLLGLSLMFVARDERGLPSRHVAKWEVLSSDVAGFRVGKKMNDALLSWEEGRMKMRLESGAILEAAGPVKLEMVDALKMRVHQGSVTVDVGEEAIGFEIMTPDARVVDLGTRFGVSVDEGESTQVVVFDGEVELHDCSSGQDVLVSDLSEGEAVKMKKGQKVERLSSVMVNADRRVLLGGREKKGRLVQSVSDNVEDNGSRKYYTISPHGMKSGAHPYPMVRRPRWEALPMAEFPQELIGADVVGTFMRDRYDLDHQIQMNVSEPCRVYVFFDIRSEVPEWLSKAYQDTGMRVRCGPWHPESPAIKGVESDRDGRTYLTYAVWAMDFPTAGTVVFGAPIVKGDHSSHAMYSIAVKRLEVLERKERRKEASGRNDQEK